MYKMAVCDIDGTLIGKNGKLSQRTVDVIKQINNGKGIVTLSTGRNVRNTLPVAKALGIKVPFSCIDGILLYDPAKGCIIEDKRISKENVLTLADYAYRHNMFMEVSDGFKYYKYFVTKEHEKYDVFNEHTFWGRIKSYRKGVRYIKKLEDFNKLGTTLYQISFGGNDEQCAKAKKDIDEMNLEGVEARDNVFKNYVFMNHMGIGKARGMRVLCEILGLDVKDVVAIGDEMNDIDMLSEAGLGVAMGNASDKVKAYADEITDTVENDGAAKILEKYFLGR